MEKTLTALDAAHCWHPANVSGAWEYMVFERCCFCGGYRCGERKHVPYDGHGTYGPMLDLPPVWGRCHESWVEQAPPAKKLCAQHRQALARQRKAGQG